MKNNANLCQLLCKLLKMTIPIACPLHHAPFIVKMPPGAQGVPIPTKEELTLITHQFIV